MNEHGSTIVGAAVGAGGVTFPFWNETVALLIGANQFFIAILGLVVLSLTVRKLWLEVKIAEAKRRDAERGD